MVGGAAGPVATIWRELVAQPLIARGVAKDIRAPRGSIVVPEWQVGGPTITGSCPPACPTPRRVLRQLNRQAVRRRLKAAPKPAGDTLIYIVLDESWSVRGGNDVVGLRHEILLIALEHLSAEGRISRWHVQIATFDCPSVFDLPVTKLDRRGRKLAQQVLLSASPGGSSILGPSLRRAEAGIAQFPGNRLLLVLSDYELYDTDPQASLAGLVNSAATEVLAISLNNFPPAMLSGSRVRTARIAPGDDPASLANHVIDATHACVGAT